MAGARSRPQRRGSSASSRRSFAIAYEALSALNRAEALSYLTTRPYDDVYLTWMIGTGRAGGHNSILMRREGALAGVCTYGVNLVLSATAEEAVDDAARAARGMPGPRSIVGPRRVVERLGARLEAVLPAPFARRASQPVYALSRTDVRARRDDAEVGNPGPDELDEIVEQSAEMMTGEVGRGPSPHDPEFRKHVAHAIAERRWWRVRVGGRLAFACRVGPESSQTAQLQGVWTPPELRGRGHATRALGAICATLLDVHPTLCLYVNDYNAPAIALYERLGFRRVGEFASIFY